MHSNKNIYWFFTGTCVFFIGFNVLVATYPISSGSWEESWQHFVNYKLDFWSQYDNPEEGTAREGDIKEPSRKTMLKDRHSLWPNGIVRYFVDDTITNEPEKFAMLEDAMKTIMKSTCVRFIRIYPDSHGNFPFRAWVNMTGKEKGCFADLGYPEVPPSTLNLNVEKCFRTKGHALHEILHILGAAHEHMRPDRNRYVKILWNNIKEGGRGNFRILQPNIVTTYGLPYDYESIMHYSMTAFSKNKAFPTIVPRRTGVNVGQRNHLSQLDIEKLLISYKCHKHNRPGLYRKEKANPPKVDNYKIGLTVGRSKNEPKPFEPRYKVGRKLPTLSPWAKLRFFKLLSSFFPIRKSDESHEDYS